MTITTNITPTPSNWWRNRRIYNDSFDTVGKSIKTNSQIFYRANEEINSIIPYYGFKDTLGHSFMSRILLNNEPVEFDQKRLYPDISDTTNLYIGNILDTIPTNWFRIDNFTNLNFEMLGFDSLKLDIYIQRESTGNTTKLSLENLNDSIFTPVHVDLFNGLNDNYRILFIRKDTNLIPECYLIVKNQEEINNFYRSSASNNFLIDLNGTSYKDNNSKKLEISIYPNPADEKIYLTSYLPQSILKQSNNSNRKINLRIYTETGKEVYSTDVNPGATIELPTGSYPTGVYFIKAEEIENSREEVISEPILKSVVIER